jgi:His/Glu/Gln/Arg/opine family amino acid ABC transporter permease subunit
MNYDWNFWLFAEYKMALVHGLWVTIQLTFYSSVIGTLLGIPFGVLLRFKPLIAITLPVNDILRAVPLLVLIYLFYYFPYASTLGIKPISEFSASLLALTIAQAAFTADIVRGAINGVSEKTIQGAKSLGFRQNQIWLYVVIPDVLRQILPTLVAFYIGNLKLSSLASVISTPEILYAAKTASGNSFRSLEAWVLVAVIYVVLVVPMSYYSRKLEESKWLKRRN